jgi:hypothetical protein
MTMECSLEINEWEVKDSISVTLDATGRLSPGSFQNKEITTTIEQTTNECIEADVFTSCIIFLGAIFPDFDTTVLKVVSKVTQGDEIKAADVLFQMCDPDYVPDEHKWLEESLEEIVIDEYDKIEKDTSLENLRTDEIDEENLLEFARKNGMDEESSETASLEKLRGHGMDEWISRESSQDVVMDRMASSENTRDNGIEEELVEDERNEHMPGSQLIETNDLRRWSTSLLSTWSYC